MPRPVFPVVRLPYDQPDRVARVLVAVRREFAAAAASTSRRPPPATASRAADTPAVVAMTTAHVQQPRTGEPAERIAAAASPPDDRHQTAVDQVTVGVRDCTLTPKVRPDILVTAGGGSPNRNLGGQQQQQHGDDGYCDGGAGPYLLVPPVNITAEISRPPLTPLQYYTATS